MLSQAQRTTILELNTQGVSKREIARVLTGEHSTLLHPFRYERFPTGDLHPVSHSPYPWS